MRRNKKERKKYSIMVMCEGDAEKALWIWLKKSLRYAPVAIPIIDNSEGGDACTVVNDLLKTYKKRGKNTRDITHLFVVIDSDKNWQEAMKIVKKHPNMRVILWMPRFEHFLMKLRGKVMPGGLTSDEEKKEIEKLYGCLSHNIKWEDLDITCEDVLKHSEFDPFNELLRDAGTSTS